MNGYQVHGQGHSRQGEATGDQVQDCFTTELANVPAGQPQGANQLIARCQPKVRQWIDVCTTETHKHQFCVDKTWVMAQYFYRREMSCPIGGQNCYFSSPEAERRFFNSTKESQYK
jgi:hypothetical protein